MLEGIASGGTARLNCHRIGWAAPATLTGSAIGSRADPVDLARRQTVNGHTRGGRQVLLLPGPVWVGSHLHRVVRRVIHAIKPQEELTADAGNTQAQVFRRGQDAHRRWGLHGLEPGAQQGHEIAVAVSRYVGGELPEKREHLRARCVSGGDGDFTAIESVVDGCFQRVHGGRDHRQCWRRCRVMRVSSHQGDDVSRERDQIGIDLAREGEGNPWIESTIHILGTFLVSFNFSSNQPSWLSLV
jgi:hypothetical protein